MRHVKFLNHLHHTKNWLHGTSCDCDEPHHGVALFSCEPVMYEDRAVFYVHTAYCRDYLYDVERENYLRVSPSPLSDTVTLWCFSQNGLFLTPTERRLLEKCLQEIRS